MGISESIMLGFLPQWIIGTLIVCFFVLLWFYAMNQLTQRSAQQQADIDQEQQQYQQKTRSREYSQGTGSSDRQKQKGSQSSEE